MAKAHIMMIKNLSIKTRMNLVIGFMSAMMIVGGLVGIIGISMTNDGLRKVYEERMRPTRQLQEIDRLMLLNRMNVANMLASADVGLTSKKEPVQTFREEAIAAGSADIEKNRDEITRIWKAYADNLLIPEEKALADRYAGAYPQHADQCFGCG